jgi:hypothetical protein
MASLTKAEGHPTLAVVVWDDAWSGGNDLITLKDVEEKHRPSVMQTLGWVLKEDFTGVFVANERCMDLGDECYRGSTFIPRSLIKSVTPFKLSVPRRKRHEEVPVVVPDAG